MAKMSKYVLKGSLIWSKKDHENIVYEGSKRFKMVQEGVC